MFNRIWLTLVWLSQPGKHPILSSLRLGMFMTVCGATLSILSNYIYYLITGHAVDLSAVGVKELIENNIIFAAIMIVIVAPIIETFLMVIIPFYCTGLLSKKRHNLFFFCFVILLAGYGHSDRSWLAISQIFCFFIMALQFISWRKELSLMASYLGVCLSHATINMTVILIFEVISHV